MEEVTVGSQGVVTLRPLLPDEISAIVVLERHQNSPVLEIKFLEHSECSPEQIDQFLEQGFLPIEIGEMGYRATGASSATEALVKILGYDPTSLNAGETKLLELLAQSNRDGYMNQFHMSLPRIFGNLYDLGYDEMELIERFKDVVHAFLEDKDNQANGMLPLRNDSLMTSELSDLVEATKKCQFAPFTPGRYLRDLWRLGEPVEQKKKKISFWVRAWNLWQTEYAKAKSEWPKVEKLNFTTGDLVGVAIETNNRFIAKVGAPTVGVFINRRLDGHAAIMTRRLDVSTLYKELEKLEPKRWYYHKPAGHLVNGGNSKASEFSLAKLVELVREFPPK